MREKITWEACERMTEDESYAALTKLEDRIASFGMGKEEAHDILIEAHKIYENLWRKFDAETNK